MAELTPEERAELTARSDQIAFYQRTLMLLSSERNLFLRDVLISKGLDPAKQYNVGPGPEYELTEAEPEVEPDDG